jgi:nucleoside-diphosphate-sugar epimerase
MTYGLPKERLSALVTGASGFVGAHLCRFLAERGWHVVAASRKACNQLDTPGIVNVSLGLSTDSAMWQKSLLSVRCVVHLAAHVHQFGGDRNAAAAFQTVNVEGSRFVAEQAARAGVRRFVYLSSVKVNGERSGLRAFRADDEPNPCDLYGRSKRDAEIVLRDVCSRIGMELVIIRAPLVYGPGVRANFKRLLNLAALGVPLPLGSVENRRSLISIWNLAHFIEVCMAHPEAAGETFLVSDGDDLSTPQLIHKLARLMRKPARLFPFSPAILRRALGMMGFEHEISRLCDSLWVDSTPARDRLSWQPIVSVDEGLARTVAVHRMGIQR